MLSLTWKAADVLAKTLRDGEAEAGQGFRVIPSGPGEIALTLYEPREGDEVITHQDQTVIVIESWVAHMLDGAVLDVQEIPGGTSLALYGNDSKGVSGY